MPTERSDSNDSPKGDETSKSLGSGAEAAAGIQPRDESGKTAASTSPPDNTTPEGQPVEREREHESGYGGKGGKPRVSSDQREPHNPS